MEGGKMTPNNGQNANSTKKPQTKRYMLPGYDNMQYMALPIPGMAPMVAVDPGAVKRRPAATIKDPFLRMCRWSIAEKRRQSISRPDMSLYCAECKTYIALRLLPKHRTYHRALDTMNYSRYLYPESVESLKQRRDILVRSLCCGNDGANYSQIQSLDKAYEFLKTDLEDDTCYDNNYMLRTNYIHAHGITMDCNTECSPILAICSHDNKRWKSEMEDTQVFQDSIGGDLNKSFFGLYDGHHGRIAAEMCASMFHHFILLEMEKFDPRTTSTDTFNMVANYDAPEYTFDELHNITTSRYINHGIIHEKSSNMIQHIVNTCEERISQVAANSSKAVLKMSDDLVKYNQYNTERKALSAARKLKYLKRGENPFVEQMHSAFVKAHIYTDMLLSYAKHEVSNFRWSGCSTLACIIQNTNCDSSNRDDTTKCVDGCLQTNSDVCESSRKSLDYSSVATNIDPLREHGVIHLANAGNSHAVLVRADRAYRLTRDHTPHNKKERFRVVQSGGLVNEGEKDLRVNGVLSTTRGLGNHGDPGLKRCVITEPYTTSVQIDQYAQFIILATNGVWEVFSEHDAASILLKMLPANRHPLSGHRIAKNNERLIAKRRHFARKMSERLVKAALLAGAKDNITVMIILLSEIGE